VPVQIQIVGLSGFSSRAPANNHFTEIKLYWFAVIKLEKAIAAETSAMLSDTILRIPEHLVFAPSGQSIVRIGHTSWQGASAEDKLTSVSSAMAAAMALANNATLTLTFSGIAVDATDAKGLLEQWVATGEPPVMSIISFRLCEDDARHVTCGLSAFIGFELSVEFLSAEFERDALRDLARLARHCLMQGSVSAGQVFLGVSHDVPLLAPDDTRPLIDYWFRLRA
jgi:hypothetical protein